MNATLTLSIETEAAGNLNGAGTGNVCTPSAPTVTVAVDSAHLSPGWPDSVNAARPLAAERPWLVLDRSGRDAAITAAIEAVDRKIDRREVRRIDGVAGPARAVYSYTSTFGAWALLNIPAELCDAEMEVHIQAIATLMERG
jgi:hypothetical protein